MSTFHDDSMVSKQSLTRNAVGSQEVISKPAVVEDYNQNMGGVDKSDQFVLYYSFAHRTRKWYSCVFPHARFEHSQCTHPLHEKWTKNDPT